MTGEWKRFYFSLICALVMTTCFLSTAHANNIKVTNCQLINMVPDAQSTTADIQFDISWENSWRYGTVLYDAAWVFAKVSVNDGVWNHATISGVTSVGASGTGLTIDVTSDNKGAFLYRSTADTGNLSTAAVKLQWNRTADGVAYNATKVKIQVFAIEMVHVPQGSFYVGDGTARTDASSVAHFFNASSSSGAAVKITSTQPYISDLSDGTGTAEDISWVAGSYTGVLPTSRTQLNANFPTGYKSFYVMKYEITQGQYRDFLNTLTRTQQQTRISTAITSSTTSVTNIYVMSNTATVSFRNGIRCDATIPATIPINFYCDLNANGVGNESADGEWIACNYLHWLSFCAYADWASLRPMTELEFEKACRGPKAAVAGEYAWGTTNITQATGISSAGTNNETASNSGNGLCTYGDNANVQGPLRSGFASTASSTTRQGAGASYYGIMELSGNNEEKSVSVMGSQNGTTLSIFTGLHGDGNLSVSGNANVDYWPGNNGTNGANGEITGANGSGIRGGTWGNWGYDVTYSRVSWRGNASCTSPNNPPNGGRCVRTQ